MVARVFAAEYFYFYFTGFPPKVRMNFAAKKNW